jgi:hypothetical protein
MTGTLESNVVVWLFLLLWAGAFIVLLRYVIFGLAVWRRRREFAIPFPSKIQEAVLDPRDFAKTDAPDHVTGRLRSLGFVPKVDHTFNGLGNYSSRLFLGEDGSLCYVSPADAPGSERHQPSFTLATRFDSGKVLCTTNIRHYSTWMDCLPGRRSQLVTTGLPFLEVYGHHLVRVSKEVETGEKVKPYTAPDFREEMFRETAWAYDLFIKRGYFRPDTTRKYYLPTWRFLLAYTQGIVWPGTWGNLVLVGSAVTVVFGVVVVFF